MSVAVFLDHMLILLAFVSSVARIVHPRFGPAAKLRTSPSRLVKVTRPGSVKAWTFVAPPMLSVTANEAPLNVPVPPQPHAPVLPHVALSHPPERCPSAAPGPPSPSDQI